MRTIPEIVAEMKALITELEQHTGLPPKKEEPITFNFNFDNMNGGIMPVSHYENMGGIDVISLSPTETTTVKF